MRKFNDVSLVLEISKKIIEELVNIEYYEFLQHDEEIFQQKLAEWEGYV